MPVADRVEIWLDACAVARKQLAGNIPGDVCRCAYGLIRPVVLGTSEKKKKREKGGAMNICMAIVFIPGSADR